MERADISVAIIEVRIVSLVSFIAYVIVSLLLTIEFLSLARWGVSGVDVIPLMKPV